MFLPRCVFICSHLRYLSPFVALRVYLELQVKQHHPAASSS